MIVVTGAAGFIGSNLVGALNKAGYSDIVVVDDFDVEIEDEALAVGYLSTPEFFHALNINVSAVKGLLAKGMNIPGVKKVPKKVIRFKGAKSE